MVAGQGGEQTRPLRLTAMPPQARGAWLPARCRPRGSARSASWPGSTGGCMVATGGGGIRLGCQLCRWRMVRLLAGWAHQPAGDVLRPARGERAGLVVSLSEGGRIREGCLAPRHIAPGGRQADLVTDDAMPGDRDRVTERIDACGRLQGVRIRVRPGTGGRKPGHPGCPAGYARPPAVPGKTARSHRPPSPRSSVLPSTVRGEPRQGEPTGYPGNGPGIP
jgi:hypothetical protein